MRTFSEYYECQEYNRLLDECANILIKKNIDPQCLDELTDIYLEFNPAALAGGIGGSMMAGPVGAVAGGMAGQKVGQGIGNWFKKGQASQISPLFQRAKDSIGRLTQAIANASKQNPQAQQLLQQAQQMQKSLNAVEPSIPQIDQQLSQQHSNQARQAGGIAQKFQNFQGQGKFGQAVRNVGNKLGKFDVLNKQGGVRGAVAGLGDRVSSWAKKNPNLAKGLQAGGAVAAAAMAGKYLGGGGGGVDNDSWTHPDADSYVGSDNSNAVAATSSGAGEFIPNSGDQTYDSSPQGIKNMSPDEYQQFDQSRRQMAIDMGNPDPGSVGQEEFANRMQRNQDFNQRQQQFWNRFKR